MEFIISILSSIVAAILIAFIIKLWGKITEIEFQLNIFKNKSTLDKQVWTFGGEVLCEDYTQLSAKEKSDIIRALSYENATCFQDCGFLTDKLENIYLLEKKRKIKKQISKQIKLNEENQRKLPYVQMA